MKKRQDTILYCGSFNPVHKGHLAVACEALRAMPDAELWFVVSPYNPLKTSEELAPETDRLRMVELALEGARKQTFSSTPKGAPEATSQPGRAGEGSCWERMAVCDIEFTLPRPSATVTTLRTLSNNHPERRFILLIGSDNALRFDRWIAYEEILAHYPVWVYPREGYPVAQSRLAGRFQLLGNVPLWPQAATDVRKLIPDTHPASDDESLILNELPAPVWAYIQSHKLYGYR